MINPTTAPSIKYVVNSTRYAILDDPAGKRLVRVVYDVEQERGVVMPTLAIPGVGDLSVALAVKFAADVTWSVASVDAGHRDATMDAVRDELARQGWDGETVVERRLMRHLTRSEHDPALEFSSAWFAARHPGSLDAVGLLRDGWCEAYRPAMFDFARRNMIGLFLVELAGQSVEA